MLIKRVHKGRTPFFFLTIIICSSFLFYNYSQASQSNHDFVNGTYSVFIESNIYYVMNRFGEIEDSDQNASRLINQGLSIVAVTGGKVTLAAGNYSIEKSLIIQSNTIFEGEGIDDKTKSGLGTRLTASHNLNEPIIRNYNLTSGDHNIIIKNLAIFGNRQNKTRIVGATGINFTKTSR